MKPLSQLEKDRRPTLGWESVIASSEEVHVSVVWKWEKRRVGIGRVNCKAVVYWLVCVPILTYGQKLQVEIQTVDLANTNFKNLNLVKSDIKAHLTSGKAKRRNPVY